MWAQLRRYVRTLRKYSALIAIITLGCFLGAFIMTYRQPKLYSAQTLIELKMEGDALVPKLSYGGRVPYWNSGEFVKTQTRILQSTEVAKRVVDALGLDEKIWTPERISGNLIVEPIDGSRLLSIKAIGGDPDLVVNISTMAAQSYIDLQEEKQVRQSRQMLMWLDDRVAEVQKDLRKSQQNKVDFAAQNKIISLEDQRSVLSTRLTDLEIEYNKVRVDRIQKEGAYGKLKRILAGVGGPEDQLAILDFNNTANVAMQGEYRKVQAEVARLAAIYGPKHPRLQEATAVLQKIEEQIAFSAKQTIQRAKQDWEVAFSKEAALEVELESLTQELLNFNDTWVEYVALSQEVEKNEEIFEILLGSLKEADVTRHLQKETAQIIEPATPNYKPFSPNLVLNLSVALVLGCSLGIVIAFVAEYYDPRIRFPSEFTKATNLPVLIELPFSGESIKDEVEREAYVRKIVYLEPASPEAELYRVLRTQVTFGGENRKPMRSVVVTGVHPREGKSTVSINLGLSIASMDRRVLMVDGDIRRASLSQSFGYTDQLGLSDVLANRIDWLEATQKTDIPNLHVLPSGTLEKNPSELMVSGLLQRLLRSWQTEYDHIIFDMPPVLAVSDALSIAASVEGVMLVLKPETSTKADVVETVERLNGVNANIVGAVFNQVIDGDLSANPYYYYYRSGNLETEL